VKNKIIYNIKQEVKTSNTGICDKTHYKLIVLIYFSLIVKEANLQI